MLVRINGLVAIELRLRCLNLARSPAVGRTPRSTAGGFSKARDSAPWPLNLKAIKRDGYLGHRA
jgi:hypothetical protein